jgi:hypothetical protein
MGGKGGGGGSNYYMPPPDTSGYATPEEAALTLAREKPLDMSKYQQAIDVQKAAAAATAPQVAPTAVPQDVTLSEKLADAVLKPPEYWALQDRQAALKPRKLTGPGSGQTTQT